MVFHPPPWVPPLPEIPDSITVDEFVNSEAYGRRSFATSKSPYTCGVTGQSRNAADVAERVEHLARALVKNAHLDPLEGTEWDRVVAIYSLNTVSLRTKPSYIF
ncbi:hypothetical protein NW754_015348 [Fusarium falciforme]|nr:hypothetical protein NW754_015348 [Fusarium falciforme]